MNEKQIRGIVRTCINDFASTFENKHLSEKHQPDGVINSKVHNIFVAALGDEVRFYSALSRSLDSSLGNMVENMAIKIAAINFEVTQHVEGDLYENQTKAISVLLQKYTTPNNRLKPLREHAYQLADEARGGHSSKRHESDYVLKRRSTGEYYLIELKLGGDLDNKKARSEKEALLEQYCILTNKLGNSAEVTIHFATGYNRYGEGSPWTQGRVRQYFAEEELLISKDFWNFVCDDSRGFEVVMDEYNSHSNVIQKALTRIRTSYL